MLRYYLLLNGTHTAQDTIWYVSVLNYRVPLDINTISGFLLPSIHSAAPFFTSVASFRRPKTESSYSCILQSTTQPSCSIRHLGSMDKADIILCKISEAIRHSSRRCGSCWKQLGRNIAKWTYKPYASSPFPPICQEINVVQIEYCLHISLLFLLRWFNVMSLCTRHRNKPDRYYYIGVHLKNGQMFSITGYVWLAITCNIFDRVPLG